MSNAEHKFIEELYKEYYTRMVVYAYKFMEDWEVAHEHVQETFVVACAKADMLMNHPEPVFWLMKAIRFTAYNDRRKRARYAKLFLSMELITPDQEPSIEDEPSIELYFGKHLSKDEYHLLKRVLIDKATFREVAEEQGISVDAAYKRMQRLLTKIRKKQLV